MYDISHHFALRFDVTVLINFKQGEEEEEEKSLFFFFFFSLGKYYLKPDGLKESWIGTRRAAPSGTGVSPYHTYKELWCNKMAHLTKALKTIS